MIGQAFQGTLQHGKIVYREPAKPIVLTPELVAEFWKHVRKGRRCWIWTGAACGRGYGNISGYRTNRVSFAIHYYDPPRDMDVCHTCDNPRCVRPDHLVLGTNLENIKDAKRKGRYRKTRPGRSRSDFIGTEIRILELGKQGKIDIEIAKETKTAIRIVRSIRDRYSRAAGGTGRYTGNRHNGWI